MKRWEAAQNRGQHLHFLRIRCSDQSGLGGDQEDYLMALAESFMISADNAHALHPNYTDKADPVNRPVLNEGEL